MLGGGAYGRGRILGMMNGGTYALQQILMSAESSVPPPSIILSPIDVQLIGSYLNKKLNAAMTTYAYSNVSVLLWYPPKSWPLPVWLGGRYMNVARLGYTLHAHTKADYFLSSYLHLAACTTKYLFIPYVTHNRKSISVHLSNGQFGSFPNQHFFEQTSFKKFKLLEPEYFIDQLWLTCICKMKKKKKKLKLPYLP